MGETKVLAAGDGEVGQLGIGEDGENGKPRFVAVYSLGGDSEAQPAAVRCSAGAMHSIVLTSEVDCRFILLKMVSVGTVERGSLSPKEVLLKYSIFSQLNNTTQ